VTLGVSGMEAGGLVLLGAFFFFKALREATTGAWEGPLEEVGKGAASDAACSGRDRKFTIEVCFRGLATGVLDFRTMLPRVKEELNYKLEKGLAAVLVPFFCTLKSPPGWCGLPWLGCA